MRNNGFDHLRIMQTAAWMWIIYLASQAIIDSFIYLGRLDTPILRYYAVNFLPTLVFLGLAYSSWLKKHARSTTTLMVLIITGVPILANYVFDIKLPQAPLSNLEGMVLRQLPVLMIGLVLVAWHYNLFIMVIYTIAINLGELSIVFLLNRLADPRLEAFYFIILIKTVCFLIVGLFTNQLITTLRSQQEALKSANQKLSHHASTLENLTVSRERNRLSRELHDTVVHTLSGLSVQLETIKAYWDVDSATSRSLLAQSLETTRSGLQETRRALKALRASPLDDLGLVLALEKLIENAAERGKLLLDVSLPDPNILLSPDVEQCIYRVAQEAIENVLHHANAQNLLVKLAIHENEKTLTIQDDGIGFNPSTRLPSGHFGLKGMHERAQLVGGVLTIQSQPSYGTTIQLVIKES
jgi:signal transduction histidine kinase